jgi:hypothetical protein
VLEVVGPSLVEKIRVPESHVLPMHREWDKASGLDMKGFGVRRLGTFQWWDMRFIIIPCGAHPIWFAYPQPGAPVCCLIPDEGGGGLGPRQHNSHLRRIPFG